MTRSLIAPSWRPFALLMARAFAELSFWTPAASRRRLGRATRLSLQALDARTLHDLGIDPGEIPFLAAGVGAGRIFSLAERSR
ncbi:MAG TPA: DUF1127 domain-containing protein [Caldimonas sp.]|nr:DUF1127 domain-containing protein [Caldimonas sp.]